MMLRQRKLLLLGRVRTESYGSHAQFSYRLMGPGTRRPSGWWRNHWEERERMERCWSEQSTYGPSQCACVLTVPGNCNILFISEFQVLSGATDSHVKCCWQGSTRRGCEVCDLYLLETLVIRYIFESYKLPEKGWQMDGSYEQVARYYRYGGI